MLQSLFITSPEAPTPFTRWLQAFPEGRWDTWPRWASALPTGALLWVPTLSIDWLDMVTQAIRQPAGVAVVVLSPDLNDDQGLQALDAGARGYCHAWAVPTLLQEVAHVVSHGGLWVGPSLLQRLMLASRAAVQQVADLPPPVDLSALSDREIQVARAVAAGRSNKEVAEQLFITERTVKAHLGAVFDKLGVRDRLQLVLCLSGHPTDAAKGDFR